MRGEQQRGEQSDRPGGDPPTEALRADDGECTEHRTGERRNPDPDERGQDRGIAGRILRKDAGRGHDHEGQLDEALQ